MEHRPMYMKDYVTRLDAILTADGRELLHDAGSVSHDRTIEKALAEYRKYQEQTLTPVEEAYLERIQAAEAAAKRGNRSKS